MYCCYHALTEIAAKVPCQGVIDLTVKRKRNQSKYVEYDKPVDEDIHQCDPYEKTSLTSIVDQIRVNQKSSGIMYN